MSTETKTFPMSAEMQADIARWSEAKRAERERREAAGKATGTFEDVRDQLKATFAKLPEKVDVPRALTLEGDRSARFVHVMRENAAEFLQKIDRLKLPNLAAFDRVMTWNGAFPGPCAYGDTRTGKTRAAWAALYRLYVKTPILVNGCEVARSFEWFPVRRLIAELIKYEERGETEDFFRMRDFHSILFVDDVDKINWAFDTQKTALFAFYDWIYRKNKPCITTTNKDRSWWANQMGNAFARRLFDDAHFSVKF